MEAELPCNADVLQAAPLVRILSVLSCKCLSYEHIVCRPPSPHKGSSDGLVLANQRVPRVTRKSPRMDTEIQ